jgi:hypothetical protein
MNVFIYSLDDIRLDSFLVNSFFFLHLFQANYICIEDIFDLQKACIEL